MAPSLRRAFRLLKRVFSSSANAHTVPPKHDSTPTSQLIPPPLDAITASCFPHELPGLIVTPLIEALPSDATDVAAVDTSSLVLEAVGHTPMEEIHGQVVFPPSENQGGRASLSPCDRLHPIMPTTRFCRRDIVEPSQPTYEVNFSRPDQLPLGWTEYTHYEGQVFFYHKQKRIITDSWLWDTTISEQVAEFIKEIEEFIGSQNLTLPKDSDLVLDLSQDTDDTNYRCGYYYAHHSAKALFWLEPFDDSPSIAEVKGDLCPSHIQIYRESEYWYNWALFPNIYPVTTLVLDQLENMLRDAQTNVQTPSQSTVNIHTFDNLKNMMQIVKDARENVTSKHSTSWFVGKFMYALGRDRLLNCYGQKTTRHPYKWLVHGPDSDQPGPGALIEHSYLFKILFKILSLLLFYAPDACLNAMEEVRAGGLTAQPHHDWTHFIGQLKSEWAEYTTYSSVLLNANVAFLAIPSSDAAGLVRSAAQTISYFSTMFSLASIVIGWLLVRQHRTRHDYFLARLNLGYQTRGLGKLAILYSFPYALLMYGVLSFFGALLTMCFQSMDLSPLVALASGCLFLASLITWSVMTWDKWWCSVSLKRTWQQLKRSCQDLIGHTDLDGRDTSTVPALNSCFRMLWPWPRNSRNTSTGLPMTR